MRWRVWEYGLRSMVLKRENKDKGSERTKEKMALQVSRLVEERERSSWRLEVGS